MLSAVHRCCIDRIPLRRVFSAVTLLDRSHLILACLFSFKWNKRMAPANMVHLVLTVPVCLDIDLQQKSHCTCNRVQGELAHPIPSGPFGNLAGRETRYADFV